MFTTGYSWKLAFLLLCLPATLPAAGPACEAERYFAPADLNQEFPLVRPHSELSNSLRRAAAGEAAQQRTVAVSYETGYLVDKCPAKAVYWYRQAAGAGDNVARDWVARYDLFEKMRQGPECAADQCPFPSDGPQMVELYASANGHFTAPVTINGITLSGIVDTGADTVALTARMAQKMGITYQGGRLVTVNTANGTKAAHLVIIPSVKVGSIDLRDVRGSVSEGDTPLLLGMSFLGRLHVSINLGRMTLQRP